MCPVVFLPRSCAVGQGKLLNDMHSEMAKWISQLMDHAQELKEMLSGVGAQGEEERKIGKR